MSALLMQAGFCGGAVSFKGRHMFWMLQSGNSAAWVPQHLFQPHLQNSSGHRHDDLTHDALAFLHRPVPLLLLLCDCPALVQHCLSQSHCDSIQTCTAAPQVREFTDGAGDSGLPEQVADLLKQLLDPDTMDTSIEKNGV